MRKVKFVEGIGAVILSAEKAQKQERVNNKYITVDVAPYDGWFHGWFQEGSAEDGLDPVAIVETTKGRCVTVATNRILFLNGENQSCVKCQHFDQFNGRVCNKAIFELFMEEGFCSEFEEAKTA